MSSRLRHCRLDETLNPSSRLWATSFSVDEHEAFAVMYNALGKRVPEGEKVCFRFPRGGFRRAGQGLLSRGCLESFDSPAVGKLIPAYHPKLILAEHEGIFRLAVSTGNIASSDFRRSRNLWALLDLPSSVATRVKDWITDPPSNHRALCLKVRGDGPSCQVIAAPDNAPTFRQFTSVLERCPSCRDSGLRRGQLIIAAPFWSPRALPELLSLENAPGKRDVLEAYFPSEYVWKSVASRAAGLQGDGLKRVRAYRLQSHGSLPPWHHKIIGWRCCSGKKARGALYLGSANATAQGLFGSQGHAVNWEAGVIWVGNKALFTQARALARAGFDAVRLHSVGQKSGRTNQDDEFGLTAEDAGPYFAPYLARTVAHRRQNRTLSRKGAKDVHVRRFGATWKLHSVRLWLEEEGALTRGQAIEFGRRPVKVPEGQRGRVEGVFKRDDVGNTDDSGLPPSVRAIYDLVEFDPDPDHRAPDTRSSIRAALHSLWLSTWWKPDNNGGRPGQDRYGATVSPFDVRFPFLEVSQLAAKNKSAATRWLKRVETRQDPSFCRLPEHWSAIAAELLLEQKR